MIELTDSTAIAQACSDDFSTEAGVDLDGLSEIHRAALAYATHPDLRWRIIPIRPDAKRPRIKEWPDRASRKPETLAKWFERWPDARIGLVTGGGLVVIDVDPKNGGLDAFARLVDGRELPATAKASSPSGGFHLYFRTPWSISSRPLPGFRGIDVKAARGFVMLPPSGHASGVGYAWVHEPLDGIARMPDWLAQIARAEAAKPARRKGSRGSTVAGKPDGAEIPQPDRLAAVAPVGPQDPPIPRGVGDVAELTRLAIARHVIPGRGHRHDRARALIGELCRAAYDGETIRTAVRGWTEHYHAAGAIGSDPAEAAADHADLIARTMGNPEFAPREPYAEWPERIARFRLSEIQSELLAGRVADIPNSSMIADLIAGKRPRHARRDAAHPSRVDHFIPGRLSRLSICNSDAESAFAEALVVRSILDLRAGRWFHDGDQFCLPLTDDSVAEVAAIRSGAKWGRRQIGILKGKYLTRLGAEGELTRAGIFEFAVEVEKGRWGGMAGGGESLAGRPSIYGLSGVLAFIDLAGDSGRIREAMQRKRSDVIRGPPWRAQGGEWYDRASGGLDARGRA